jgi:spermidine synthase
VDRLDALGRRVGGVFSVNTIGTVIGACLTGFVLLPRLGLERTLMLGCTVSGLLGVALLWVWRPRRMAFSRAALREAVAGGEAAPGLWIPGAVAVAAALLLAVVRPNWDPRLMQHGLFRWANARVGSWEEFQQVATRSPFIYARDGADGTIAVQKLDDLNLNIRVNGKVDASVGDMATQLMVGHLPMFLHPDPKRVMVVGLGCGATASAVLRHPGVTADVAEISPEMVEAARFFGRWTDGVLENPRMALHVLDAREFLLLTRDRYDVIVSEPTNVWVPGVANLFTRDFYKVVRSKLKPGGIFTQWIHVYAAEPRMVASVVTTVRAEFPYVSVWLVKEGDLIMVAGDRRPDFDADRFAERLAQVRPVDDLPSPPRQTLASFLHPTLFLSHQIGTGEGMEMAWPMGDARVFEDLRPALEYQAARAQFVSESYRVRAQLDERMTRLGSEPLFVEQYLERHPLDDRTRLVLADLFGQMGGSYEDLRAALTATVAIGAGDLPALLSRLPDALLAKLALARALGREIDRGAPLDAGLCEAYLGAEHGVLRLSGSVFGRAPVAPFEARVERCMQALPAHAEKMSVGLAKALADAGAAEPALRRIRQIETNGALERLPAPAAADLLVSGSVLLLQSSARDSAFPWAARALKLDPGHGAAARIVLALRPSQPLEPPRVTAIATQPPG